MRMLRVYLSQRVRLVLVTWLVVLMVFAGFRAGLMIAAAEDLGAARPGQIATCFLVGIRYDSVAVGYAMMPLLLVLTLAPNAAFGRVWFRRLLTGYAALIVTAAIVVEIVGMFFFLQFGDRLNYLALDVLEQTGELTAYIRQTYPTWIVPVAAVAGAWGAYRLLRWLSWLGERPRGPIWPRPLLAGALVGVCYLIARGGLSHHRMRFGPAYFSHNSSISQLTLNNFFTFGEAWKSYMNEQADLTADYPMPDLDTAWRICRDMLAQETDTFLGRADNPLWRRTDTGRPLGDYNVAIIVMEGMSGPPVGALARSTSHTPNLDALCRKGMFFEQMYAVGDRTCRGLVGILCGHPDLENKSLIKRSRAQGNFLTLPGILRRRGYQTMLIYGGDADFDNMQGFFRAGGVERIVDRRHMDPDEPSTVWGTHDEGIYRKANEVFTKLGDRKFFATILTVSNHKPFDVPTGRTELLPPTNWGNRRLNGYRYADWALGDFFRAASKAPYFKRTIFLLVSDQEHGYDRKQIVDVIGFHMPCLVYAPGIVRPRRITTTASQADVPSIILSLLGGSYEHCFLGRNVAAEPPGRGFAFLRNDRRLAIVRGRRALVQPPGAEPLMFRTDTPTLQPVPPDQIDPEQTRRYRLEMLSYFQAARHLYFNASFRPPAK